MTGSLPDPIPETLDAVFPIGPSYCPLSVLDFKFPPSPSVSIRVHLWFQFFAPERLTVLYAKGRQIRSVSMDIERPINILLLEKVHTELP